ncbi:MAG TPA: AtpZ/AtpI family protein [Gemmatimonadales bacterium]|nr:AtpZ/AtpI family protein [Gemmatimonadales bacterium]
MAPQNDRRPSFEDFDARLRRLRGEPELGAGERDEEDRRRGLWSGVQAGIEVVVALAVGVGIGWGLDTWLGTMPLFLVAFFFLGGAAGVLNAYRTLNRVGMAGSGGEEERRRERPGSGL